MNQKTAFFLFSLSLGVIPLSEVRASDAHQYEEGKELASQNQASVPQDARAIPDYQGTNIPEAHLSHGGLQDALTVKLTQKDNAAALVNQSHDERLRFQIDPATDPLFKESDRVVNHPLKTLQAEVEERALKEEILKSTHTCQAPGKSYTVIRTRELRVQTVQKTQTYAYTHIFGKQFRRSGRNYGRIVSETREPHDVGHDQWYDYKQETFLPDQQITHFDGCNYYPHTVKTYYKYTKAFEGEAPQEISQQEYESKTLKAEDIRESWSLVLQDLEQKIDQGLCIYVRKHCRKGPATRLINGFSVTRPCWGETLTYECSSPYKSTCDALKAKGCIQIKSTCQEKIGDVCVLYEQTYECTQKKGGGQKTTFKGNIPYCLDGTCAAQDYEPHPDMMTALSKLMIFKEMQKDMDATPTVFKGEVYGCNRNCVDFRDCCGRGSGWGVSFGLTGCSEKEKALAKLRVEKKCVLVGTYCAETLPGVGCIRKKTNFCCFGTRLSRVIHEQGRPQLGWGFGSAEHPQCQGFRVEDLVRLDFDKIDLSELLRELYANFKAPNLQKLSQDFKKDGKHKIPTLEKDPHPPLQTIKERTKDATF